MERVNIKEYKQKIREDMRQFRSSLSPEKKIKKDANILKNILKLNAYQNAKTILCYMSTPKEIQTAELIKKAWADGKQVALPKCVNNPAVTKDGIKDLAHVNQLDFYYIKSFDDLSKQSFGLMEPNVDVCKKVTDFKGSVCIIPAFCFDVFGYRIGYGGGYYDRFLQKYRGAKIGVVYKECVFNKLQHGRYDIPTNYVVTDLYIKTINGKKTNI
ncbi:MAG: 5-formyltetrahydrofolate cyclo-ligase [Oscillospiraceae bacterium]